MLIDEANRFVARITHYHTLKKQAQHAQAFETRANQLQKAVISLKSAVDCMKALNATGIPVEFKLSSKDKLQARTEQLIHGFASDPAFIEEPGFNLQYEYLIPLNGITDSVKSVTLNAWQSHVATVREQVSTDILNALRAIPEYRPIVATIQRSQEHINRLAETLPTDIANATQTLVELSTEQREAWKRLTGGNLPKSVISFLRASMGDGADLQLLTAEVIDWLKARKLDSAFRIKARNSV